MSRKANTEDMTKIILAGDRTGLKKVNIWQKCKSFSSSILYVM